MKYTIITHGHGDHVGGAKMMQDRFGSRIVMGSKDWQFVENSVNRFGQGPTSVKPKRDIVAEDGQKLTLGDTTVTLVATPGHTEGTFSMFFDVKDNGKPLTVAYSGGTAFNFVNTVDNFQTYIDSQRKMIDMAKARGATVVMSNHSEFDNAATKVKLVAARKPGEPHPFELGAEAVGRYFKGLGGVRAGRPDEAATGAGETELRQAPAATREACGPSRAAGPLLRSSG